MSVDLSELTPTSLAAGSRRRSRRRRSGALASYLVMIVVLITLNFLLPRVMPGNPIDGLVARAPVGFTLGEKQRSDIQEYYGLNGSLLSQYRHYLWRLAHGDLGRSISSNTPVSDDLRRAIPWTVLLIASSILLSTAIGIVAGVHSGWRRDRPLDRLLLSALIAVWEFPPYLLGSLMILLFVVKLPWFPLYGSHTPFYDSYSLIERVTDITSHLALPLVVLTASLTAGSYLVMRAGMVNELGADYLLLGRAKGLHQRDLKYRYAARNALLPVVGLTAVELGSAVAANVLIERTFSYPGLGRLLFDSIDQRDYPSIQGVFLVLSVGVVTINMLADVLYRRLDPRTTA